MIEIAWWNDNYYKSGSNNETATGITILNYETAVTLREKLSHLEYYINKYVVLALSVFVCYQISSQGAIRIDSTQIYERVTRTAKRSNCIKDGHIAVPVDMSFTNRK